jgi:hypothetical protein
MMAKIAPGITFTLNHIAIPKRIIPFAKTFPFPVVTIAITVRVINQTGYSDKGLIGAFK